MSPSVFHEYKLRLSRDCTLVSVVSLEDSRISNRISMPIIVIVIGHAVTSSQFMQLAAHRVCDIHATEQLLAHLW